MISTAMLHGANNPTLGRDAIFAVIMIALNGLVGLSLVLGGLRYREQHYNIQGVNAYLNVIMALAVLGLVLPNFTTSTSGPTFSTEQGIFFAAVSLLLYAIFLLIQTLRHRGYFLDLQETATKHSPHHLPRVRSTGFHALMLLLYLATVILLAEKFAVPLDNSIETFNMPQAFGGAIIAALVLSPEGLGGITASLHNQLQRSINILFGSVLATIGLTIPAVPDDRIANETAGGPWSTGWQSTPAALNAGCERGHVHEPENQRFARVYSFSALRRFRAADFCALTNEPFAAADPRRSLCRSVHHDSVGPLFNDLESKSLVETQHRFASHEADRDRRVIGICADQLRQQSRADAMPAVLRFHRQCKLRRRVRFVGRPSEPGCAQQSLIFLVMRNKSSIADAAPAFYVTGNLWAAYDIARRRFAFSSGGQAVIQHLPKNGFILGCKLANHVVHRSRKQCLL